jgi:hypothetical protein
LSNGNVDTILAAGGSADNANASLIIKQLG